MSDDTPIDVWYYRGEEMGTECIKVRTVNGDDVDLDIRDAVYFRYLLDGAISDYERAVGR